MLQHLIDPGVHPASYSMRIEGSSTDSKEAKCETDIHVHLMQRLSMCRSRREFDYFVAKVNRMQPCEKCDVK
jgi:hypothetical protein